MCLVFYKKGHGGIMNKIRDKHRAFMAVRVSNWLGRDVYDSRLVCGRWQARLNDTWPPIWQDLSALLQGRTEVML